MWGQVDAEMVTLMGRNAMSVDDYLTAIRYFNQAIEAKPYLSRPYYYRAYAKFTLEDYAGAAEDCDRSIQLNPFITEVYQLRALCRIHRDQYHLAAADYTRVLSETPEEQSARYNRALCYLQLKDYARADSDLNFLLQKPPVYYRTYMAKAQLLFEQGDTLSGMNWVDTLLVRNPKEPLAWRYKGTYALSHDRFALADSCLSRAIALQPSNFELFIARAQARHALSRFGQAISDYDRALELQPKHFVAHYNRGLLRSFVGDLNRAIEDFDFILKVEPTNTLARYNRAQLREKTGNFRGAISDYSELIRAYPSFYAGYIARAALRRKIGDTKGALADETVIARRELDISLGRTKKTRSRKVRLRSEHELDQYQQLVEEDPDTVRHVFGTLYGKVQNEKVDTELLPMYVVAFRPVYTRGYHAVGYAEELSRLALYNTPNRTLCLTAESDKTAAQDADADYRRIEEANESEETGFELSLARSAVSAARYDYTSALNEASCAVRADSSSVLALIQRAYILSRSVEAGTLDAADAKSRLALATADLFRARLMAQNNAYIPYNQGCLLAQQGSIGAAIDAYSLAIALDAQLAEAYYNRALLYLQQEEKEKAIADFSRAGQLGLYRAYAQLKQINNK